MSDQIHRTLRALDRPVEPPTQLQSDIPPSVIAELDRAGQLAWSEKSSERRRPVRRMSGLRVALVAFTFSVVLLGLLPLIVRSGGGAPESIARSVATAPDTASRSSSVPDNVSQRSQPGATVAATDGGVSGAATAWPTRFAVEFAPVHPSPLGDRGVPSVLIGDIYLVSDPLGVTALDPSNGAERWRWEIPNISGILAHSPDLFLVAAQDGTVAAGSVDTGTEVWRLDLGTGCRAVGAAIGSGLVYVTADRPAEGDNESPAVITVDASTGALAWQTALDSLDHPDPSVQYGTRILTNGQVVVKTVSGVHALETVSGVELWANRFGSAEFETQGSALLEESDGVIYASDPDGGLVAVGSDGVEIWTAELGPGKAALGDRQLVHVGSAAIKSLDRTTGIAEWSVPIPTRNTFFDTLAIADDLIIVVAASDVLALDLEGSVQWTAEASFVQYIIFGRGVVVLAGEEGVLVVDACTGTPISGQFPGVVAAPTVTGNELIMHQVDGTVRAFGFPTTSTDGCPSAGTNVSRP